MHKTLQGLTRGIVAAMLLAAAPILAANQAKPPARPSADMLPPGTGLDMDSGSDKGAPGGIRAQLRPTDHTILSSEIAGKIVELPVREGDRFRKGQRLVAFDCSVYRAQLDHSVAAETGAGVKLRSADQLSRLNGISQSDLAQAQAQYTMARAQSALDRAMVQRCDIVAPFSGRVSAVKVQRFSFVPEGTPMLEIYDDSVLELEMIVPSRWLAWLRPGYSFSMRVDEAGRSYQAQVMRISASVDPVSQTVKIFGRIVGQQDGLLPGMSGTALLAPPRGAAGNNVRR